MNGLLKEIGKYFVDISKLIFGGAVLASILKIEDINKIWIFLYGFVITIVFAIIGFYFQNKKT